MSEIIQQQDSRREFIDTLCELAERDAGVVLVLCDTGFNYIEKFKEKFPGRLLNLGVTEMTAMIFAAGLSLVGRSVWVYSMIPFVTFRVHEAIRNAVCMHETSVKIIGVKGSEKYRMLGFSHNLLREDEEVDFLSKLPRLTCYLPRTNQEVRQAVLAAYRSNQPSYIRL